MKLIGLCGYAQVGKDTAFREIKKLLKGKRIIRLAFADSLKQDVNFMVEATGMMGVDVMDNEEDKKKFRTILVAWGKQMREINPYHWVNIVEDEIIQQRDAIFGGVDCIIITDVRYINEIKMILERDGQVIRLERQGYGPANEEEKLSLALIDKGYPDLPVVHNDGTPEELAKKTLEVVK